jgi:hypothetical protein
MPWRVSDPENSRIIEIIYTGVVTEADLQEGVGAVLGLIKSSGRKRVLTDCTAVVQGPTLTTIFLEAEAVGSDDAHLRVREALLLPDRPQPSESVKFWETSCRNRGHTACTFRDRQSALEWLSE